MSPPGKLGKDDLVKVGKGAVIAMLGALLTYFATCVMPDLAKRYPEIAPFAAAGAAVLINLSRKLLVDTRPTQAEAVAALSQADQRASEAAK